MAQKLAHATGERLVWIAQALANGDFHYSLGEDERIAFCFPIHGWRPPFIVRDFVKRLKLEGYAGQYCYAFATCGDDVGLAFDYLEEDLQEIHLRLDSAFSVIMPETYNFPFIDQIDTLEVARKKVKAACERLERILPDIIGRRRGVRKVNESRWPRINSRLLGSYFLKHWVTDQKFTVEPEACIRCGKCASVCPVGNIDCGQSALPTWMHNGLCTTCFACYHHCPAHAIDFDGRTKGKRQYFFSLVMLEGMEAKKYPAGN